MTLSHLSALTGPVNVADLPQPALKELQVALAALDYRTGAPDGIFGPRTEQAWKQFKSDRGQGEPEQIGPGSVKLLLAALEHAKAPNAFREALRFTLQFEGGKVNDPHDPGGRTNKGITQRTYDRWRLRQGQKAQSVYHITDEEVEAIYRRDYWTLAGCEGLALPLACVLFDSAVNYGPGAAKTFLDRAVAYPISQVPGKDFAEQREVAVRICDARIAQRKRSSLFWRFGVGWLRRDRALKALVQGMKP